MTGDRGDNDNVDDDDLLKTFKGILISDDVVTLTEQAYEFVRRGRDAALSFVSEEEEKVQFNLDVLEAPDTEIRIVEEGPGEPPFQKIEDDEDEFIELNFSVLDEEEREQVVSKIEEEFEKQRRFLTHEQEKGFGVAENAKNDPEIREILDFFDFLESRDKQLLRRGLSIRNAWEDDSIYIPRDQMEEWKDDLKTEFGDYGSTVANFCSSKYFDPGNAIQNIMTEVLEEHGESKARSLYYNILSNEPFVVYVGKYDNAKHTSRDVREKIKQYDSYPYEIPFVDLRAQGYRNRRVAEQAIEHLREDIPESAIERQHSDNEFVFRIDPELAGDIEGND